MSTETCHAHQLRLLSENEWLTIIDANMRLQMLRNKSVVHWPETNKWRTSATEIALLNWLNEYATGFYYFPTIELHGKIVMFENEADMVAMIMHFNGRDF